jgi:hypothetical protein
MISQEPSAPSQSCSRTIVFYVRHCHQYCYEAPDPTTPPVEPAEPAGPPPWPASTPPSSDDESELGFQIGEFVSQHRDEFHLCPHNFLGHRSSTLENINFIRGLPHNQRDCRPCEDCLDVCFRHNHPCPPLVLTGARGALDTYCTIECVPYGSYSRPSPLEFRVLHNCSWRRDEVDPVIASARQAALSGSGMRRGLLSPRPGGQANGAGYPRVPFGRSLQVCINLIDNFLFLFQDDNRLTRIFCFNARCFKTCSL